MNSSVKGLIEALRGKKTVLITTSNRYSGHAETPKSTQLAYQVQAALGSDCKVIEIPKLQIHNCEGNVSSVAGNNCGVKAALLKNKSKNPTGLIRCWASVNHKDDELYKVANAIFEADAVIFFISMRWGQANAYYQKLIERLEWIENRDTTLGEGSIIAGKVAGCVITGHNWRAEEVMHTQMQVYRFYGFNVPTECSFYYQYTKDDKDETQEGYLDDIEKFTQKFE